MKNCKDSSRKISRTALEIATSINNTAVAAHHCGESSDLPVSVAAALGATNECVFRYYILYLFHVSLLSVFVQCARFMVDTTSKGPFTRYFQKGLTVDTVNGYLDAVEGLCELLKVCDIKFLKINDQRGTRSDSRRRMQAYARALRRYWDSELVHQGSHPTHTVYFTC